MKVKFKQSVYIIDLSRVTNVDEEIEVRDDIAKNLIEADYAEEVVEVKKNSEKPVEVAKEEVKPQKRQSKKDKDGE